MSDLSIVFMLLAAAIAMFALGRPRMDVVALLMVVALPLTGIISVQEALAGFSDPNIILIAALFVVGEALVRTGVAQMLGDWLVSRAGRSEARLIVLLMIVVAGKPDPTFVGFEELLAPIRSATTLEGALLERGIEAVCSCRDDLVMVPLENPLPVLPEARAFLRRNEWSKASGLRLGSEVHTREFYRPDLLVVDRSLHRALLLDIKRSVASHKPKVLAELRTRMMAAALVTRDWLERECDAPPVERVEIAIIDGSGDPADHARAIFALSDLDQLIGITGAAKAIEALRHLYAARLREILLPRCRSIAGVAGGSGNQRSDPGTGTTGLDERFDGRDDGSDDAGGVIGGITRNGAGSGKAEATVLRHDARVSVGIASLGGRT